MNKKHIGFLHPGAMGVFLAATVQDAGHTAYWVSKDRSSDTRGRAKKHSIVELRTIKELCDRCSIIISVCPPHAASDVAKKVMECSFMGVYADVNAISPQHVKRIGQVMNDAGVEFIDGGIIGIPAWRQESTWLYLSGHNASHVADCFRGGPLAVEIISDEIGKASALKMCFAANTKGTTALLCAIVAAAEKMGVRKELEKQWSRDGSDFAQKTLVRVRNVATKAWRFSGEMEEIASTLEEAGLPSGFHLAASDIFQRIARFKDSSPELPVEDILGALLGLDQSKDS
jgi:3-hydroxyisobutyrate dehydrogenase-like beta-hydroxyacid dehydrogenase